MKVSSSSRIPKTAHHDGGHLLILGKGKLPIFEIL